MQKRQRCKQERGLAAKGGKGRWRKQGLTEKAQWGSHHRFSALSPATLTPQPVPPARSALREVPWPKWPASYRVISTAFKEVQNQNTMTKWEFLCQEPRKPERLVYSLMKFLLQSLHLFFTGEQRFL